MRAPAPPPARLVAQAPVVAPDTLVTTGLTAEEAQAVEAGFLPPDFAELRALQREQGKEAAIARFRAGKKGPFDRAYGDPDAMLAGARRWLKDPELARLVKAVMPGDVIVTTYNKDNDVISQATKGPFIHAAICVSAGAPPEFVEAIGLTGDLTDPGSNKVLRTQMHSHANAWETVRLLRPAAGLSPLEREKAVQRAVAYAQAQLGKPYDFAFTERNGQGWNDSFYCSELAYKAYADRKGADLPIRLDKSADRDESIAALGQLIAALKPDDAGALTFKAAQLSARKDLTTEQLLAFITTEVLPATEATRAIANTPARRQAAADAIRKVLEGHAFPRSAVALQRFSVAEQQGEYRGVGGFFRRVGHIAGLVAGGLADARALTHDLGFWRSLGVAWRLFHAVGPHADTLTTFFFGANDPRTRSATRALDQLDALGRDVRRWPVVGRFWPLPTRPSHEATRDFVSPTDLGWADVPHWDFNVKAGFPIDKPTVEAKKPPYAR